MMPISCDRQQVYLPGYHWQFNISNLLVTDVYSTNCDYFEHFWYFKLLPMIHNNSSYHLQPINYDLRINGINCTQTTNPLHRAIETCNINETNNQQNHSELSQSNAQCHGHQHFVYYRDSKAVQAVQWSFGIEKWHAFVTKTNGTNATLNRWVVKSEGKNFTNVISILKYQKTLLRLSLNLPYLLSVSKHHLAVIYSNKENYLKNLSNF